MNIMQKLADGMDVTFNFVGDSITMGEQHCRSEETYVAKIGMLLSRRFPRATVLRYDGVYHTECDPIHEFCGPILVSLGDGAGRIHLIRNGVGGNTVVRAHRRIHNFTGILPSGARADVTFLMLGINDAIVTNPEKYDPPESYRLHYRALVEDIQRRDPETRIVLITSSYNDQSVGEHVAMTRSIAEELSLSLIDLHALWTAHYDPHADNFGHGDWLAGGSDACHFTPKSAEISAAYILDAAMKIFTE